MSSPFPKDPDAPVEEPESSQSSLIDMRVHAPPLLVYCLYAPATEWVFYGTLLTGVRILIADKYCIYLPRRGDSFIEGDSVSPYAWTFLIHVKHDSVAEGVLIGKNILYGFASALGG